MNLADSRTIKAPFLTESEFNLFERFASKAVYCTDVREFAVFCLPLLSEHLKVNQAAIAWKNQPQSDLQTEQYKYINADSPLNGSASLDKHLLALSSKEAPDSDEIKIEVQSTSAQAVICLDNSLAAAIQIQTNQQWNDQNADNLLRAVAIVLRSVIRFAWMQHQIQTPHADERKSNGNFEEQVNRLEAALLYGALKRCNGNFSAAARDLGITARMVRYKVQKLNIPFDDRFKNKA